METAIRTPRHARRHTAKRPFSQAIEAGSDEETLETSEHAFEDRTVDHRGTETTTGARAEKEDSGSIQGKGNDVAPI